VAAEFYPLGRRVWRVGSGICQKADADHQLTLTTCRSGEQFTCDDGTCVRMQEVTRRLYFKGTVSRDFLLQLFSVNHLPPKIPLGSFRIFSKIRGDIRSSRSTTGVVDTSVK
jgi:hypothetical protein